MCGENESVSTKCQNLIYLSSHRECWRTSGTLPKDQVLDFYDLEGNQECVYLLADRVHEHGREQHCSSPVSR